MDGSAFGRQPSQTGSWWTHKLGAARSMMLMAAIAAVTMLVIVGLDRAGIMVGGHPAASAAPSGEG